MENPNSSLRKKIHDFSQGPVWEEKLQRWCCRLRLPADAHGYRKEIKKRFRNRRAAERWFHTTESSISLGTFRARCQKMRLLTLGGALDLYRGSVRSLKSFRTSIQSKLSFWERKFGRDTRLSSITRQRIVDARAGRIESGIKMATTDGELIVLKSAFNFLQREKFYDDNPAEGIKLFRPDNRRLLYLQPEQFFRLLSSCDNAPWFMKPAVIIATLTGLRKANVLNLQWNEIDFDGGLIRISGAKMKNGKTLSIPICDAVYNVLECLSQSRSQRGNSRYVFVDHGSNRTPIRAYSRELKLQIVRSVSAGKPIALAAAENGIRFEVIWRWVKRVKRMGEGHLPEARCSRDPHSDHRIPYEQFDRAWLALRSSSGIEREFREKHDDSFHFHDLRHTFASWQALRGVNPFRLKELMGHGSLTSTERYVYLAQLPDNPSLRMTLDKLFTTSSRTCAANIDIESRDRETVEALLPKNFPKPAANTAKPPTAKASQDKPDMQPSLFDTVS